MIINILHFSRGITQSILTTTNKISIFRFGKWLHCVLNVQEERYKTAKGSSYLCTPRSGSGVTEEFRTTPELFELAGKIMLLDCP